MSMENIRDLFLEDETFEDARNKFNTVLQRLFRSMIDTESNEGALPGDVTDPDSDAIDGDYREVDTGEAETGDFAGDADTDGETPDVDQGTLPDGDNEADNAGYDYEDPEEPEE